MLSTKHDSSMQTITSRRKEINKPSVVVDYNKGKAFIDLSDQMSVYSPYLRRTLKWYKTVVFHLLTATTVVNALVLYNKINNTKINITKFKEKIVEDLLRKNCEERPSLMPPPSSSGTKRKHCLRESPGQKRLTRKDVPFTTTLCQRNKEVSTREKKLKELIRSVTNATS